MCLYCVIGLRFLAHKDELRSSFDVAVARAFAKLPVAIEDWSPIY